MVDVSKYKKMFVNETTEHLEQINETLELFAEKSEDQEIMNTLFRSFHSIKGMAASMNYRHVQEISHKLEDLLDGIRGGKIFYTGDILNILYDGTAVLEKMVGFIEDDSSEKVDASNLVDRLVVVATPAASPEILKPHPKKIPPPDGLEQNELELMEGSAVSQYRIAVSISSKSACPPARAYVLIELLKEGAKSIKTVPPLEDIEQGNMELDFEAFIGTEKQQEDLEAILSSAVDIEKSSVTRIEVARAQRKDDSEKLIVRSEEPDKGGGDTLNIRYRKSSVVKVDTQVLDSLIDIVGEMFIQENQLMDVARHEDSPETIESVNRLEKLVRKLYKDVMTLRLVPISMLSDIIPRVMREVIRDSGKKVDLLVKGKDIKLDRSIIEKLGDPVIHLVRNSLDHGIDLPEERVKAGKPECGVLTFAVSKEKDSIKIELSDDGRGMDVDKIKQKAVDMGLSSSGEIEIMSEEDIYSFIWHPGFSTAGEITSVSGRGVGMDIVKNVIDGLGGRVWVESEKGKGCTFHLQVPLTMAIIKTFRIKLQDDIYAIPMGRVVRTIDLPASELKKDDSGFFFLLDEEERIETIDLREVLRYKKNGEDTKSCFSIIVIETGNLRQGLIVDAFLASYETVVKALGAPLEKLEFISGASMSEKGEIILILDIDRLLQRKN